VINETFQKFPSVFARLKGRNGCIREYRALIGPLVDYCVIPKADAYRLGYPEAARDDFVTTPPNLVTMVTTNGYVEGMMINLQEVAVGPISFSGVDFIAFDIPQVCGYDVILGQSLLQHLKVEIDYSARKIRIEKPG
jgi:predicted aspartyl protease